MKLSHVDYDFNVIDEHFKKIGNVFFSGL